MAIQWYPGHMTSARKKAAETMASIDVVIEVLDARLPEASTNPMVRELRLHRQRPCLKVLNKSDLADPAVGPHRLTAEQGIGGRLVDLAALHQYRLCHCCSQPFRRRRQLTIRPLSAAPSQSIPDRTAGAA